MSDLATTALTVAKMLGRANTAGTAILDLEAEIKVEVKNAIRHYNRKPLHLLETRGGTLTTTADVTWYSAVNVSSAVRDSEGFNIIEVDGSIVATAATSIFVDQIIDIHYMRENPGASGLNEPMREIPYVRFEQLQEGSTATGQPEYFTRYAGQIGIWPTPGAAHTIYWAGLVKPVVPSEDNDPSIWFTEANELIEAATAQRVSAKYLRDDQQAAKFAAIEAGAYQQLRGEYVSKSTTGRIKAHE
jgi:hypothetical protein